MNADLALKLAFDGITLLARVPEGDGWYVLDTVALDAADLAGALANLRTRAEVTAGPDFTTLLVLPNDQLLYSRIDTNGQDPRAAAAQSLDGATPYPVSDLSFDTAPADPTGQSLDVVAVALETLMEAETFALEHGFRPVGFGAIPAPGRFAGAPHLGQCGNAEAYLNGATLTPETTPIQVVPWSPAPTPVPVPAPSPKPNIAPTPSKPTPAKAAPASPSAAPVSPATSPAPLAPTPEADRSAAPTVGFASRRPAATQVSPGPDGETQAAAKRLGALRPRFGVEPVGNAPAVSVDSTTPGTPPAPLPAAPASAPPAPAATTSTTARAAAAWTAGLAATGAVGARAKGALARLRPSPKEVTAQVAPEAEAMALSLPGLQRERDRSAARLGLWLTLVLLGLLIVIGLWSLTVAPPAAVSWLFGGSEREEEAIAALPPAPAPATTTTPEAMTLPADLLPDTTTALDLAPAGETETATALAALSPQGALADADTVNAADAPAPIDDGFDAFIGPPPVTLILPTPAEVLAQFAESGAWVAPPIAPFPAEADQLSDLYVTTLDAPLHLPDPIDLPRGASLLQDAPLAPVFLPPPPGSQFALDARGLVIPTPEGAPTPDGALVFSGRPPVDLVTRPRPEDRVVAEADPDISPQEAWRLEMQRIPPTPRPEDFAERVERAQNGGFTRVELARLRPQPRPQSLQDAAAEAAASAAAASLATGGVLDAPEGTPAPEASDLAVASTAPPTARPSNFAELVAAARERAASSPAPQAAATAAVAAPSIPSSASVTRAATQRNVLALNRMTLIGVFGQASDRGALVRMRSGRTRRVEVGDRLDGGQVIAIGEGQLVYRKRNRDITLEMPRI